MFAQTTKYATIIVVSSFVQFVSMNLKLPGATCFFSIKIFWKSTLECSARVGKAMKSYSIRICKEHRELSHYKCNLGAGNCRGSKCKEVDSKQPLMKRQHCKSN